MMRQHEQLCKQMVMVEWSKQEARNNSIYCLAAMEMTKKGVSIKIILRAGLNELGQQADSEELI